MVQVHERPEYDGAAFYGLEGSIVQENNRGMMVRYDNKRKEVESWKIMDESPAHLQNFLDCIAAVNSRTRPLSWPTGSLSGLISPMSLSDPAGGSTGIRSAVREFSL
ncbi:MAG: hypothetical protein IPG76_18035 [Acidobacteria bacterium]|nr:hypothetical protein [Acidobacteriota bacterium]